jgi:hypothetical protein
MGRPSRTTLASASSTCTILLFLPTMQRQNDSVSRPVSLGSNSSYTSGSAAVRAAPEPARPRTANTSMAPATDAHPRQGQHLQQRQQAPAFTQQNQQNQQPPPQHGQLQQPQRPHPRSPNPAATAPARCHRCLKPLSSKLFLLTTCNCVFCEGECPFV